MPREQAILPLIRDADRQQLLPDMQDGLDKIVQSIEDNHGVGVGEITLNKLRYHVDKGVLLFKLVLPGREKLERDGFRTIGERVRASTATPVFYAA